MRLSNLLVQFLENIWYGIHASNIGFSFTYVFGTVSADAEFDNSALSTRRRECL